MRDVLRELTRYIGRLLHSGRRRRGTGKSGRASTCFRRTVLALCWFRHDGGVPALAREYVSTLCTEPRPASICPHWPTAATRAAVSGYMLRSNSPPACGPSARITASTTHPCAACTATANVVSSYSPAAGAFGATSLPAPSRSARPSKPRLYSLISSTADRSECRWDHLVDFILLYLDEIEYALHLHPFNRA